ncbi:translation termination factor GTPase eRF3, partial [Nowakowskiella sp. JEL0078]
MSGQDSWEDDQRRYYQNQGQYQQQQQQYQQQFQQMDAQAARLSLGQQQQNINYNLGAAEFVPSWIPQQPQAVPSQWSNQQQIYPQYQQQSYQQPFQQQYRPQQVYQPQQPYQQAYQPKPVTNVNGLWSKESNSTRAVSISASNPTANALPKAPAVKETLKVAAPPTTATAPPKAEIIKSEPVTKLEITPAPKPVETKSEAPTVKATPATAPMPTKKYKDPDFSDIKDDGKETLNVIFIGHVDAGKSTLSGHLLYLSGMVDKRTMDKYQQEAKNEGKESWYLSWVMDLNEEERSKGKTVEYGRGFFESEKRRFTLLDAPGHGLYVPSMLSGAAQADVGILVLSARKGEFETGFERGGQTREHAMLAKTAGVKKLICVVNKMDEPTVLWSKERYDEILQKINPFLKQAGFKEKREILDLEYIPVSGFSGDNLKERISPEKCSWYNGPSLLELLDNMEIGSRKFDAPLMMPISDKFKDMGTIITGKIESGRIRKGQNVLIMPNR